MCAQRSLGKGNLTCGTCMSVVGSVYSPQTKHDGLLMEVTVHGTPRPALSWVGLKKYTEIFKSTWTDLNFNYLLTILKYMYLKMNNIFSFLKKLLIQ